MAKPIEPPILMSRILTFVLATSLIVLGALGFTLFQMIPLERPEVFFLVTPTISTNVVIQPLNPDSDNKVAMDYYIKGFVREYVIARNTLNPNAIITKNNWAKVVKPWSSTAVYSGFTKTNLYNRYTLEEQTPNISCSVNFSNTTKDSAVVKTGDNSYHVNFVWICENIGGQTIQKNYKIQIKIQSELENKVSGLVGDLEKLSRNPLGIQVVQYTMLDGERDPLDSDILTRSRL